MMGENLPACVDFTTSIQKRIYKEQSCTDGHEFSCCALSVPDAAVLAAMSTTSHNLCKMFIIHVHSKGTQMYEFDIYLYIYLIFVSVYAYCLKMVIS